MLYVRAALLSAVYTCSSAVCTIKNICFLSSKRVSLSLWVRVVNLPSWQMWYFSYLPSKSTSLSSSLLNHSHRTDWICFRLSIISQSLWVVLHFIHLFPLPASLSLSLSPHAVSTYFSLRKSENFISHTHGAQNHNLKNLIWKSTILHISKCQIWVTIRMLKKQVARPWII